MNRSIPTPTTAPKQDIKPTNFKKIVINITGPHIINILVDELHTGHDIKSYAYTSTRMTQIRQQEAYLTRAGIPYRIV